MLKLLVLGALVLLAGVLLAGFAFEQVSQRRDARRFPPPGRIVDAGGRNLHLLCQGDGAGPAIVVEQGAGSPSIFWWPVQRALAKTARVCTYDRAGYLWSAPLGFGRSITARVDDLRSLLVDSGLPGPFVMVAHSYGGLLIGQLARRYPELVAGIVFIDTPDERALRRKYLSKRSRCSASSPSWRSRRALACAHRWWRVPAEPALPISTCSSLAAPDAPSAMIDDFADATRERRGKTILGARQSRRDSH
jgi:pimeloyl-ACP methyl ester carboxylesterase